MNNKTTTPSLNTFLEEKKKEFEKTIENSSGNILVRFCPHNEGKEYYEGMPIVEALNLYDDNKAGCAVVFWELRKCDGSWIIEAKEIHDRLTSTKFDEGVIEQMFYWGRKISDVFMDFIITNFQPKDEKM